MAKIKTCLSARGQPLQHTNLLTFNFLQESNLIRPGSNSFAKHDLSEILDGRILLIDGTEIKMMIFIWDDRFFGVQPIHVQHQVRLQHFQIKVYYKTIQNVASSKTNFIEITWKTISNKMNSSIPRNGILLEINLWNPHLDLKFLNCKLFIGKYGFYDWLNKCVFASYS